MTALPEYKTRHLLADQGVPLVNGMFVAAVSDIPSSLPEPPVYLKAQIPGATSRASQGLVRRIDSGLEMEAALKELLSPGIWGQAEGVLITDAVEMVGEYYVACMLDLGGAEKLPGGVLLFSTQGGSGVEARSEHLIKIPFSLLRPPDAAAIVNQIEAVKDCETIGLFLEGVVKTFIRYKLIVLEMNPVGILADGSLLVIDCRAEFEKHAVGKNDKDLFTVETSAEGQQTRIERMVGKINAAEPAGTGFVRENREPAPDGVFRVATNLCGGGGKMLWEMTTGARTDIYSMNESDTSGGLSAFKSYRILRAILEIEAAQVLLLTGSGMGFQDQYHLASAVWKALRESPTPLPALLRFGGTAEDEAYRLFERVAPDLPVNILNFKPHVFPNAMVDRIADIALEKRLHLIPPTPPAGAPAFSVKMPPGDFFYFPEKWTRDEAPPCVGICPTRFLKWNAATRMVEPAEDVRCVGCLLCETVSLLEGNGELYVKLDMPEVEL
jgi:succinyl-CoA synthetase beta subunit/NAD-dependent dihydropyrimidine dehydrogenase PreA subunit